MSEHIKTVFYFGLSAVKGLQPHLKCGLLCFLFAVTTLLLLPAFVFVAAETSDFRIAVGAGDADPGGVAEVSVSFSHNPGIAAFSLRMDYDSAILTPVSIARGAVLDVGSVTSNLQSESDSSKLAFVSAVWVNPSNFTGDGVIYTVKFKIHESASGNIPVTVSYEAGGIVNQNYEDIEARIENGNISINPASGTDVPALPDAPSASARADPQSARSGEEPHAGDTASETQSGADNAAPSADAADSNTPVWNNPFKDVSDSDWFYDSVRYVCENKLMNGMSDSAFAPQTPVSRAMFATILHRLEGEPAPRARNPFSDVRAGQWYADAIAWASENAIVMGYGDSFGVDNPITREQIATILFRYANSKGVAVGGAITLEAYTDRDRISDWARDSMRWADARGIITGRAADLLVPDGTATRAEAAEILRRFADDSG
jgi:hypothetical protein